MPSRTLGRSADRAGRARPGRRQGLLAAAAAVPVRAMRRDPQLRAGHGRAGLLLLRPPQPDRRGRGRDCRAAAGACLARCGGRASAERARTRQMRRLRCRRQFRAAELRRAMLLLRPAGGGRPRPLPQDPPDRDAAVPDRRPGGTPAGRRLAQGPVVRTLGHVRAGARPRPAARRLPALLDLRQSHPHPLCRPARRRLLRDAVCRHRRRRAPGAPGGAGAQGPLAPGQRRGRPRFRRRAGAGRQHAAGPSGRGARALGPGRDAPVHARLSERLRRRAVPAAGRPGLCQRAGGDARGDRLRHPTRHRR